MGLQLMPQCCCEFPCLTSGALLTMSGVTNGSCSSCSEQFNDTTAAGAPNESTGWTTFCGITNAETFCSWSIGLENVPCFDDDNESTLIMFTGTDGKKYIGIQLEDEDFGGFGATFAAWIKEVTSFTLPQTLTSAHQCFLGHGKCNFSSVVITVEPAI